ncbi:hypothetical protein GCU68_19905 (plasmid) [Natronorubrum aibiense]|uniref:Uncharacterized protein n=1 Tax=Natronorubrum aibiense TaxID=348826 RepID=A0A5P9P9J7_9EURY|nr:hypothetical protein GCU68_19905 [Natronorubrum aibiense]
MCRPSRKTRYSRPAHRHRPDIIVATENHCTPDRTTVVRSVCKSVQLLLEVSSANWLSTLKRSSSRS